jgi:hypothetical protein
LEPQIDEAKAVSIFRQFDDPELEAMRWQGGQMAARLAEAVLGERSKHEAYEQELRKARADAEQFARFVADFKERLPKLTGSERTAAEDGLKMCAARLSGALDEIAECEKELAKA